METKSQFGSSINWIAFVGGMYAFLSLCSEFYTSGKIDIDENTAENLFYFSSCVIIYIRRTYFPVKPLTKRAAK